MVSWENRRHAAANKLEEVSSPTRLFEITTGKGPIDPAYLLSLKDQYAKAIRGLVTPLRQRAALRASQEVALLFKGSPQGRS